MSDPNTLTEVQVLEGIRDICRESPDGLVAWRMYRIKFGDNHLAGRTAGDREKEFLGLYNTLKQYPAQFTMKIRLARVNAFVRKVTEAYMSVDVLEHEVEAWLGNLERANSAVGIKHAVTVLAERRPELVEALAAEAELLWPSKAEPAPIPSSQAVEPSE